MPEIKEASEFIDALASVSARIIHSLSDDGRVSTVELAGFIKEFSVVKAGLIGASDIPFELTDLTLDESKALRSRVVTKLTELGVTGPLQEVTNIILEWLYDTAVAASRIKYLLKK